MVTDVTLEGPEGPRIIYVNRAWLKMSGYVRQWCPELARLPDKWLHRPHEAPLEILHAAGVKLGRSYPHRIVSHVIAREVALEAYARTKSAAV